MIEKSIVAIGPVPALAASGIAGRGEPASTTGDAIGNQRDLHGLAPSKTVTTFDGHSLGAKPSNPKGSDT